MRVLVAEDDNPLARFLHKGLQAEGYATDVVQDGEEAQFMAVEYDYDLLILDLNLPRADGLTVLKHVRAKKSTLSVLILTARSRVEDIVKGLDMGANDYMVKPISFSEFAARVRVLLRRIARAAESLLRVEDLEMDRVGRSVKRADRRIELTPKEFALLEYLMLNSGRRVTRAMIIEHVWNLSFDTMTNVVKVYINYLRKRVDAEFEHKLIRTVRGVGYQLGAYRTAGQEAAGRE